MEYVQIEGITQAASRVGLGTWAIGGWMWGGSDEERSIRTICTALKGEDPGGPAGACQRRIVKMKITASSRIMTAMKKPEKVRKPEMLALTPPMSLLSSSSCWRRLDVST